MKLRLSTIIIGILPIFIFLFTPASFYGEYTPVVFWDLFAHGLFGQFIYLVVASLTRNPNKEGSPIKHSWGYLLADNATRVFNTLILLLFAIRFLPQLFNVDPTPWNATLAGSSLYAIITVFVKRRSQFNSLPNG